MTAFNVIRVRVKPGREEEFIEAHRSGHFEAEGARRAVLLRTGDRSYCLVGEWDKMESIVAARPAMAAFATRFRDLLEDLGSGLGISDAVSGEAVVDRRV
jgi:heme-degrading monooxygenase HmoA